MLKHINHVWTLNFVQDRLSRGTGIRQLTVLDEFMRESLCIRVERRLHIRRCAFIPEIAL